MDIPGYKLAKEGAFYFLFKKKTQGYAEAVSSKLRELNNIPLNALTSPPIIKDPIVKPGHVSPELQSALVQEIAAQTAEEKSLMLEQNKDNSVEVIPDMEGEPDVMLEGFKAEDIKISVIRPSPVKEVPSSSVGDKDNDDATSGSSIQVSLVD